METSAARNAGLPIVTRGKTPFIYTSFYEGRSCNKYLYVNAWVPDQQVAPIVDYFMKNYKAKTFFLIGSDYAFGRGMLRVHHAATSRRRAARCWAKSTCRWTAPTGPRSSASCKAANPDALITSTAGGAPNVTLTKQLRAAGIKIPYGNLAVDEGTAKSMGPDAEGIFISGSYFTNIDSPKNKEFLAAMQKKFGADLKTPNDLSVPQYEGVYAYKAAVEKAGSTDADKVIAALAEVSFDGPRGMIKMNKQRHAPLTMYLGQVQKDGSDQGSGDVPRDVDPRRPVPEAASRLGRCGRQRDGGSV